MKPVRFLFLPMLFLFVYVANAQHPSITFFGGINAANMPIKYGNSTTELEESFKTLFGMNLGAFYEYILNKSRQEEFSLETGLIFETKGYHQKLTTESYSNDNRTTLYYLDIPLYIKYIYRFRSLNKVYFGAGPYIGLGLFGNSEVEFQYSGTDKFVDSQQISWGSNPIEDHYTRLDYGLTGKIGFLMDQGLNLFLSYDYGLPNISATTTEEQKNRLLRLSIGYTLKLNN